MGLFPIPLQRYAFFFIYAIVFAFFYIFFALFYNYPHPGQTTPRPSPDHAKTIPEPRQYHPRASLCPSHWLRGGVKPLRRSVRSGPPSARRVCEKITTERKPFSLPPLPSLGSPAPWGSAAPGFAPLAGSLLPPRYARARPKANPRARAPLPPSRWRLLSPYFSPAPPYIRAFCPLFPSRIFAFLAALFAALFFFLVSSAIPSLFIFLGALTPRRYCTQHTQTG